MFRKLRIAAQTVSIVALMAGSAMAADTVSPAIQKALINPSRPQMDMWRDPVRHPGELLTFAGLKPGMVVADFGPGDGYYTRIIAKTIGPKGKVYPVVNLAGFRDARLKREDDEKNHRTDPVDLVLPIQFVGGYENVQVIWENIGRDKGIELPQQLDLVLISNVYHDTHNKAWGPLHLDQVNNSLFLATKPGGTLIVTDHATAPGKGFSETQTLHRSDKEAVKAEIMAAGWVFDGESNILANASDDHTVSATDKSMHDKTDQYVLRFKKPLTASNGNRPKENPYKQWEENTWHQPNLPDKFTLHIFYHKDGTYEELQDRSDRLFAAGTYYTAADGRVCILHQWPFYQHSYIICSAHPAADPGKNLLKGIVYPPTKIVEPDPEPPYVQP